MFQMRTKALPAYERPIPESDTGDRRSGMEPAKRFDREEKLAPTASATSLRQASISLDVIGRVESRSGEVRGVFRNLSGEFDD